MACTSCACDDKKPAVDPRWRRALWIALAVNAATSLAVMVRPVDGAAELAAFLDDRRRGLARAEAGEARHLRDFSHHRAVDGLDLALVERNDEGFAGSGDVLDFDVHGGKRKRWF